MCIPDECRNSVLKQDEWEVGPCGENPRELLAELTDLRAVVAKLPKCWRLKDGKLVAHNCSGCDKIRPACISQSPDCPEAAEAAKSPDTADES